ncbi:pentatricopeptide repeat-containing protein At5g27110 [Selaginella moellendorffii]|uniref:pentatricopeptide repeat-containing protein At5g27110 n=1 Tax=Selaginella moellendorffii TaxID=88036 RepID=UPI000D1C7F38|nr:pentatricopeptide repeat-containing protein At5g27110 [Selaginella moellendorffii]|eukprot:XP_024534928.1 pentatricopeptide repeat-containing protein At5g27110 [Selaginella moellendorffii]
MARAPSRPRRNVVVLVRLKRWMSSSCPQQKGSSSVTESELVQVGLQGDPEGFVGLLRVCAEERSLEDGRLVHEQILKCGYGSHAFLGNLLVDMYGKCGDMESARAAFQAIQAKNIYSWTILLTAYSKGGHGRAVLRLVQEMDLEGFKAEKVTYLAVVDACAKLFDLNRAKQAHSRIVESGWHANLNVGNALVGMYGRCGDCQTARMVFEGLPEKTVVSWNTVIGAYARNGLAKDALRLMKAMDLEGMKADRITFLSLVEACTGLGCLAESRLAYARIVSSGLGSDVAVAASLVNMFGKSSSLADAKLAFDTIPEKNVISWNVMMAAYNQNGCPTEALRLFYEMTEPDKVSFLYALDACVSLKALSDGRDVHASVTRHGFGSDLVLGNALINMYSKCSSPADARNVFDGMTVRDSVSWNTMIATYARNGFGEEAVEVFHEMALVGIPPDKYTLISALDGCCGLSCPDRGLKKGREIHRRIQSIGFMSDVALQTGLIKMYGKFGEVIEARRLFDGMSRRVALTWARMITAYGQNGFGNEAIELYKQIDVVPDKVIFASVLDACSSAMNLEEGKRIHARIVEGKFEIDTVVNNTLLDLYGMCGCLEEAKAVFHSMQEQGRDVVSWNSIIRAHLHNDQPKEALGLFFEMQEACGPRQDRVSYVSALDACSAMGSDGLVHGKTLHGLILANRIHIDVYVGTALVTMYGRCGDVVEAKQVFDVMPSKNAVTWTSMIRGYSTNGFAREAVEVFQKMEQEGCRADKIVYVAVMEASRGVEDVKMAAKIHSRLSELGWCSDSAIQSSLIAMHGKCGSVEAARRVFDAMEEKSRGSPAWNAMTALLNTLTRSGKVGEARRVFDRLDKRDVVSWTSMMVAYASHGSSLEAIDLFQEMQLQGMEPDEVAFLAVLFACNHAGFFRRGWDYFASMRGDYDLEAGADHYCCVVDLLGRAGRLADAEDLIVSMPFKPDEATWSALVGACNTHGDVERAARISRAMEAEERAATHVSLCNTFVAA